jgi:MoaA/NifB/PqqE/SkfB family radical SAM enzyme
MHLTMILRSWGRILQGYRPALSLEITNKCPLSCPGCYAYQPNHVSGIPLESIPDLSGDRLVQKVLELLDRKRPLGIFLVGGEPMIRVKELKVLLPEVSRRGIQVEVVTSGVVPIPEEWDGIPGLTIVVSVDGLQPDHDRRRHPATYQRILANIAGRRVGVHCTITSQMLDRQDALRRFVEFWSALPEVWTIRMSLYTPQIGEQSEEIPAPERRELVFQELDRLKDKFPKLRVNSDMLRAYRHTPESPAACIFSRVTECLSADLETEVKPCQLGGEPDCSRCGCVASVGMQAIGNSPLLGGLRVGHIFWVSDWIGSRVARLRAAREGRRVVPVPAPPQSGTEMPAPVSGTSYPGSTLRAGQEVSLEESVVLEGGVVADRT